MLVVCPACSCKSRIATSKAITEGTREIYCQCLNLNCAKTFVLYLSFAHFTQPKGTKPCAELQPELCKNLDQMDLFCAENAR